MKTKAIAVQMTGTAIDSQILCRNSGSLICFFTNKETRAATAARMTDRVTTIQDLPRAISFSRKYRIAGKGRKAIHKRVSGSLKNL
jgi:hypothetical protein